MKKLVLILSVILKSLLILWVPILLAEEIFLNDFSPISCFIFSIIASILCLILYIKTYKKIVEEKINCYFYNILNVIVLLISNLALGYFFCSLRQLEIFYPCVGSDWDCAWSGMEYVVIGVEYALLFVIILGIWLLVRFVKFLYNKLWQSHKKEKKKYEIILFKESKISCILIIRERDVNENVIKSFRGIRRSKRYKRKKA